MNPPKRMFRDRRIDEPRDRRRIDHDEPQTVPDQMPDLAAVMDLSRQMIVVPVHRFVDTDTYHCLRGLEDLGFRVTHSKGASAIDVTRSAMATKAVETGMESLFFIDADMMFDPSDVVRLLMHREPVVCGAYAAKKLGTGQFNALFMPGINKVKLGDFADKLYPVRGVGAGFMRIKVSFLEQMISELKLPRCRIASGHGWPFFMPVVATEYGQTFYHPEDYAFCWRCRQMGTPPLLDTSFRLYHIGDYAYGWEEAKGEYIPRVRNMECDVAEPEAVA